MFSSYQIGSATFVFGHKGFEQNEIKKEFPNNELILLKQVHGIEVHKATGEQEFVADGHWTDQKNLAIGLVTADCIPVLFYSEAEGRVAACHAGWRGLIQGILPKTVTEAFSDPTSVICFVGHHIRASSFEVGGDVAKQIQDSCYGTQVSYQHKDPSKKYIDLTTAAVESLKTSGIIPSNVTVLRGDTYSEEKYRSYRRTGPKAGRMISFVFLQ
jgi:YfiH family protein